MTQSVESGFFSWTKVGRPFGFGSCLGVRKTIYGDPDPAHICTSYVERQNWTLRGRLRRYTRLSNGFSRKIENHMAAVALNYFAYNFINIHSTLRTSPAMAAGVVDRLFDVSDLVAILVESESKKAASLASAHLSSAWRSRRL